MYRNLRKFFRHASIQIFHFSLEASSFTPFAHTVRCMSEALDCFALLWFSLHILCIQQPSRDHQELIASTRDHQEETGTIQGPPGINKTGYGWVRHGTVV